MFKKFQIMLVIKNLQFERDQQTLFEPINLQISSGTCLQFFGANGIGKTTALRILAGLNKARRGAIFWQNIKVSSLAPMAKYLGHEYALNLQLSITENLTYYAQLFHADLREVEQACHFFSLTTIKNQWVETLSAGQKHRCQLAKLLIHQQPIWLLDEPFTTLDQQHINQLLNLFKTFTEQGGIIIFTSHHPIITHQLNIQGFSLHHANQSASVII